VGAGEALVCHVLVVIYSPGGCWGDMSLDQQMDAGGERAGGKQHHECLWRCRRQQQQTGMYTGSTILCGGVLYWYCVAMVLGAVGAAVAAEAAREMKKSESQLKSNEKLGRKGKEQLLFFLYFKPENHDDSQIYTLYL